MKSATKNGIRVILNLSSNIVNDPNDENTFLHKLLLTNTQVSMLRKAFSNGSSANIKLSKTQLHKIGQSIQNEAKEQKGAFLSMLLGTLRPSSLESLLTGIGIIRADKETIRAGENF